MKIRYCGVYKKIIVESPSIRIDCTEQQLQAQCGMVYLASFLVYRKDRRLPPTKSQSIAFATALREFYAIHRLPSHSKRGKVVASAKEYSHLYDLLNKSGMWGKGTTAFNPNSNNHITLFELDIKPELNKTKEKV